MVGFDERSNEIVLTFIRSAGVETRVFEKNQLFEEWEARGVNLMRVMSFVKAEN
jgi:hypothetical protein